jgi:hypothetical protein
MKRRGMGNILGVIIFVGILTTSIIPLQLYVKENIHHSIRIRHDTEVLDDYRNMENLNVMSYPKSQTSDEIIIKAKNTGPIPVLIKRVWIKDNPNQIDVALSPGEESVLGSFSCVLVKDSVYGVKVSTERGRMFSSEGGNLHYMDGTWYTPTFGIQMHIANDKGKYYIEVSNSTWSAVYSTQGEDWGDLLIFFDVSVNGPYYIVCRKNSVNGPDLPGTPLMVELMWPAGPPIVFVFTSGYDV